MRIRPELNLDYPHSDIAEIKKLDTQNSFEIIATFMGLYGVASPLPGFYTEDLLDDEWDEKQAVRGFLDVIHQQIYPLLYQAWLKYRFSLNAIDNSAEKYWEIIYSLIGLGKDFRSSKKLTGHLLKYAGILSQQPRTQQGLQTILSDYFSDTPVDIQACVARKVSIVEKQRCRIGQANCHLGANLAIGQQVDDRSGKYRIVIGPIDRDEFNRIIDDDVTLDFVKTITGIFLIQPLIYEVELLLKPGSEKPVSLGNIESACLGKNTWLIHQTNKENISLKIN